MEHVLLVLRETEAEWEARIRGMFRFFDASGRGHLNHEQIEDDLSALHLPPEGGGWKGDYARELLRACDRDLRRPRRLRRLPQVHGRQGAGALPHSRPSTSSTTDASCRV
ncbi:hypothetical protein GUJ93_ZPchr0012g19875 [Zizania palustris]|uniref:EF-hand domain-containing protein n=1 Tax=Zizania palustris TaxID=103762 RepID=A0A8J6BWE0_ZIZPA|nr:hypothetical protein GUJ93_ZPchr0012g19875 [Zizania palustris]